MFSVLDASSQHVWVHPSYTLALIYPSPTAGCSRTKPLCLQPAAQDPPHLRECRTRFISGTRRYSNIATLSTHVYKVKQVGREQMLCLLSTFRYSLILGSLWRQERHPWLSSLRNTRLYLSDGGSAPTPFRDGAGEREAPYQIDNCLGTGCNHCL